MLANISFKNKEEFIGNKGLGFRSVLNWVSEVKIKTKNSILKFSPKIAKGEKFSAIRSFDPPDLKNSSRGHVPYKNRPHLAHRERSTLVYYGPCRQQLICAALLAPV